MKLLLRHEHRATAIRRGPRPVCFLSLWIRDDLGSALGGIVAIDLVGAVDVLLREDGGRTVVGDVAVRAACAEVARKLLEPSAGSKDDVLWIIVGIEVGWGSVWGWGGVRVRVGLLCYAAGVEVY